MLVANFFTARILARPGDIHSFNPHQKDRLETYRTTFSCPYFMPLMILFRSVLFGTCPKAMAKKRNVKRFGWRLAISVLFFGHSRISAGSVHDRAVHSFEKLAIHTRHKNVRLNGRI
jgi:hypothetical protein